MTCGVITLSAVTKQVDYLPSRNPCDRNFISAGHTYISEPAYRISDHCHEKAALNWTHVSNDTRTLGHTISYSFLNASDVFNSPKTRFVENITDLSTTRKASLSFTNRRQQLERNETARNCTKYHRHISVHQIHRYPPSVKFVCLIALMIFVAGYAIGYGPSK